MKIQKAIVNYKGKEQLECLYGTVNKDGNEVSYYFLGEDKTKKFSNGSRLVVDNMAEALDYNYFKEMMPELHSIGLINKKGDVIIPLENKSIKPITDKILLVERTTPVSQSVIDAVARRKENEISDLVSTPAEIKAAFRTKIGHDGSFVFNDQFNEATVCSIDGVNLVNNEYYSFINMDNDTLYLSSNVPNSEIKEFSISKGELISGDNKSNEVIDVNNVGVDPAVVNDAMASAAVVNPPVVDPNVAIAPVVEEPTAEAVAEPTVDAADAPVVEATPVDVVVEAPAAEVPVTDDVVATVETPAVDAPVVEESVAEATIDAADAPVVDAVSTEAVVDAPASEGIAAETPVVDEPIVEEAEVTIDAADAPVVEAAPADAVVETPVAEVPVTEDVVETPAVDVPVAEEAVAEATIDAADAPVVEETAVAETPAEEKTEMTDEEIAGIAYPSVEETPAEAVVDASVEEQVQQETIQSEVQAEDPMAGFDAFFNTNIPADAEEVKADTPLEPTVPVEETSQEISETPVESVEANAEEVTPPVVDVAAELENIQVSYDGRDEENSEPAPVAEEKEEVAAEEIDVPAVPDIENVESAQEEVVEEDVPLIDIFKEEKEKEEAQVEDKAEEVAPYEFHSPEDTFTGFTDSDLDLGLTDNSYLDDIDTDLYNDDSHDEFMDEFNKTMANLVDQNKEQKEEISQLRGRLSSTEAQRRNLAEKYKDQTKKLETVVAKAKNLDSMLARSEEKNRQKDEIITDLQKAVRELKRQNKSKKELVNILHDAQQVLNDDEDSYYKRIA